MKNWKFVVMLILEIKITVFACLLSSEGCDSFPNHLDLALAPNKTNEGVLRSNGTCGNIINQGALSPAYTL